jgi:hypothetical protein
LCDGENRRIGARDARRPQEIFIITSIKNSSRFIAGRRRDPIKYKPGKAELFLKITVGPFDTSGCLMLLGFFGILRLNIPKDFFGRDAHAAKAHISLPPFISGVQLLSTGMISNRGALQWIKTDEN